MNNNELLTALIERAQTAEAGYFQYCHVIACELPKRLQEQLGQLVNGPVYDGDVISKSDRDELLSLGIAIRVCCKGEQGFTAAKYLGYSVMRVILDIREGKVAA